jgi:hypothetical protein
LVVDFVGEVGGEDLAEVDGDVGGCEDLWRLLRNDAERCWRRSDDGEGENASFVGDED